MARPPRSPTMLAGSFVAAKLLGVTTGQAGPNPQSFAHNTTLNRQLCAGYAEITNFTEELIAFGAEPQPDMCCYVGCAKYAFALRDADPEA